MSGDAFETGYLRGDEVIHREKVAFRAAFAIVGALSLVSGAFSAVAFVAAASAGDPQALVGGIFMGAVAGVLALASVVGSVLRTIVTTREVILHAGIRHEVRVPLAGITGVALTRYDADARRRAVKEGKGAFVAIHPSKEIVRIEWVDAAGKDHVAFVASEAPEALADVVRRAAATARGTGPKVRVTADERRAEDEAEDGAEDEAVAGPERREHEGG